MSAITATDNPVALKRRIKRHLIGRPQTFFVVTAPGLESLCRRELQALPGALKVMGIEKGGLRCTGRLHAVYAANLHCRTAHRILMRVSDFRAETFETLIQKTAQIPWELYLPPDGALDFKVSAHRSRLYHSGAVAERLRQGIATRIAVQGLPVGLSDPDDSRVQVIHARLTHNRCQLSIDSSGANLHKRGIRATGGQAPLRETLAAAVLLRAGFTGREMLCDPMCGSGTFAIEGALITKKIPPGWYREFAFQQWPAFRIGRWHHIRRMATPPGKSWSTPLIWASDQQADAVHRLQQILSAHGFNDVVHVTHTDFGNLAGAALGASGGIVVLNPPYGRRMGSRKTAAQAYNRIAQHLHAHFKGWKAAVLAPSRRMADLLAIKARRYTMRHGGQTVHLLIGKIPR
jgi:putative N6-adenine-specific DNA methylase